VAENLREIVYYQAVTFPILYAQQVLDHNHNGLLSVQEASENPIFSAMVGNVTLLLTQNITTANGTAEQLSPRYNTNNDTFISIDGELKPRLIDSLKPLTVVTTYKKVPFCILQRFKKVLNDSIVYHRHLTLYFRCFMYNGAGSQFLPYS
jgi:uncharacterized protein